MKVVSLINGSLLSKISTIYAYYYAKSLNYKVKLVFIKRKKDSIENKDIEELKQIASSMQIDSEFIALNNLDEFKNFVQNNEIDIVFCSTRHKHSILDKSFVKKLISKKIQVDLAVVKVVKMANADNVEKIILPIRNSKLSVRKFSIFTTFLNSYNAKGEIYSVENVTPIKFDKTYIKEKVQKLIFELRHYFRLLKLMNIQISIKYNSAISTTKNIESHIAKNGYDLAIIGGDYNKKIFNTNLFFKLFKNPIINTIYFIPYEEEK